MFQKDSLYALCLHKCESDKSLKSNNKQIRILN